MNFIIEGRDSQRVFVAGSYPEPRTGKTAEKINADITIASGCKTVTPQHHDPIFKGGWETDLSILKQIHKDKSDIVFLEMFPGGW